MVSIRYESLKKKRMAMKKQRRRDNDCFLKNNEAPLFFNEIIKINYVFLEIFELMKLDLLLNYEYFYYLYF